MIGSGSHYIIHFIAIIDKGQQIYVLSGRLWPLSRGLYLPHLFCNSPYTTIRGTETTL